MTDAASATGAGDLAALRAGGKRTLAEVLARIERSAGDARLAALVDAAYLAPRAHVIGFTGPPGVGKSTLIDALLRKWRTAGVTVGVIAVDPSSRLSRGALLGDRIRIRTDPEDQGVFVRSLASRGRLGGLAELAFPVMVLMRAVYDISTVADSVVLCVQPGSGDSLQFMKAGIMEVPDIAVVTKADVGASAQRAFADLRGALGLASGGGAIACLTVSATTGAGLDVLLDALDKRFAAMAGAPLARRRQAQAEGWLRSSLLQRFGEAGLAAAAPALALPPGAAPFGRHQAIEQRLRVVYQP
jgi:LAO/AO transport system kinase